MQSQVQTILFITTKSTKRQSSWKPPNGFPSELKIKNSDTYTADIAACFQYIRDQMLFNENELTRAVRSLQCDLRQIKHAQAAATVQYNGWLAAAHLKLPKCTKLSANGETVTALKCQPTIVDFKTEVTKCGAQPRYIRISKHPHHSRRNSRRVLILKFLGKIQDSSLHYLPHLNHSAHRPRMLRPQLLRNVMESVLQNTLT